MTQSEENQPRGAAGRFISEKKVQSLTADDLPELIHQSSKVTGGIGEVVKNLDEKKLEDPIVEVKVNNPFSWFKKYLEKLRKKQTTTVTLKLGIPLIALPIILVLLFSFILYLSNFQTKQSTFNPTASAENTTTPSTDMIFSRVGTIRAIIKSDNTTEYYLVLAGGDAIKLDFNRIEYQNFINKRVLLSGLFNAETGILKVENLSEINPASASPGQTFTPEVTAVPSATALSSDQPSI